MTISIAWQHVTTTAGRDEVRATFTPYKAAVYSALCEIADKASGACFATIKQLCARANLCESTVHKYLAQLIDDGLLARIEQFENGRQKANMWIVQPISDAIAPAKERVTVAWLQAKRRMKHGYDLYRHVWYRGEGPRLTIRKPESYTETSFKSGSLGENGLLRGGGMQKRW